MRAFVIHLLLIAGRADRVCHRSDGDKSQRAKREPATRGGRSRGLFAGKAVLREIRSGCVGAVPGHRRRTREVMLMIAQRQGLVPSEQDAEGGEPAVEESRDERRFASSNVRGNRC